MINWLIAGFVTLSLIFVWWIISKIANDDEPDFYERTKMRFTELDKHKIWSSKILESLDNRLTKLETGHEKTSYTIGIDDPEKEDSKKEEHLGVWKPKDQ